MASEHPAEELKSRLSRDLKHALQARDKPAARVLRSLIGEIDNAAAVALPQEQQGYEVHDFAAGTAEVPRRALNVADLQALLHREQEQRQQAAAAYEAGGRTDEAQMMRESVAIVGRYLVLLDGPEDPPG